MLGMVQYQTIPLQKGWSRRSPCAAPQAMVESAVLRA